MRHYLVAGNWKMNCSRSSIDALLSGIKAGLGGISCEILVCPPFVFLDSVSRLLAGTPVALGAQNIGDQDEGAFTGEVSGGMLVEAGCHYVIVGHSERRHIYGENNALAARRFAAAKRAGLTPILCVGETLEEREQGLTEMVLEIQLDAVLEQNQGIDGFRDAVIAYEPVWAIGTGKAATPDQAQTEHAFIRNWIAMRDATLAKQIRILYGGSVKSSNARALFAQADIDGGLIGGASLDSEEFLAICRAAF
jgi:triosephosphate isomerase